MAFLEEYTLLDELGQGGFATVYKVRHNELGYIRALRVMNAVIARGAEDKTYQRFIDECRLLMRLGNGNHPNIVHISKTLLKEQRAAVEMDFVDGASLMKYVKKCQGFVPVKDVMRLLEQMSSALSYCHHDIYRFCMDRVEDDLQDDPDDGSKVLLDSETVNRLIQKYRVIHNDIHSDNIIRREDGNYVLLDFGLAIQGETVVRSSRRSDGAPEFKAPEKWDGEMELTTQSDIYSFGVVLYEFLTGRVPFPLAPEDAGSAKAIYLLGEAHKSQVPDSIYELRKAAFEKAHPGQKYVTPDYPLWLEDVVMKCLEKNPQDRFLDGKELYEFVVRKKEEDRKRLEDAFAVSNGVVPAELDIDGSGSVPQIVGGGSVSEIQMHYIPADEDKSKEKTWRIAAIIAAVVALLALGYAVFTSLKAHDANSEFDNVESSLNSTLADLRKQLDETNSTLANVREDLDEKNVELEKVKAELQEALKPVSPLSTKHAAIVYLEKQANYSREQMQKYPELEGLWDAINTYDCTKYASYFGLLENSTAYIRILNNMLQNKSYFDKNHSKGKTFVPGGEDQLSVNVYLMRTRVASGSSGSSIPDFLVNILN